MEEEEKYDRNNLDAAQAIVVGMGLMVPFWVVVIVIVLALVNK